MKRRTFLASVAGGSIVANSGCLSQISGFGLDTEFETTDAELPAEDPPDVTVDDNTVTVRGTIEYGSSECGAVELAHAEYETSQEKLDVLVVAADDSGSLSSCSDDLVQTGYRLEATVNDLLRSVAATEHHLAGETYSTTIDSIDT
ncbi:hypothetical protein RBH26_14300 [Natronolimnohabitans sp. A-GB9]|uniref:hypothetical protein n=1 Tax=Natronolimnohabitans sp. A-GB9 TaxID=3069757 RepID=UPI0027AF0D3E|nr:hypothetical protein [Natronolimnohabitans sp. A-GB9]MDQ2051647.1 hypothetical protein [Natronolimnohabitans sp. A-GB9]